MQDGEALAGEERPGGDAGFGEQALHAFRSRLAFEGSQQGRGDTLALVASVGVETIDMAIGFEVSEADDLAAYHGNHRESLCEPLGPALPVHFDRPGGLNLLPGVVADVDLVDRLPE